MRTKGKNPDNALSTVPGTWLTLGFSLCSAIINKSRNMGIYLFPLSPSSYPPHNEIPAPLFGPLPCYSCLFFFLTALLEYNCFTMLYYFLLYNKVNQLYIYIYIYPHSPSLLSLPPTLLIQPLEVITKHRVDLPHF